MPFGNDAVSAARPHYPTLLSTKVPKRMHAWLNSPLSRSQNLFARLPYRTEPYECLCVLWTEALFERVRRHGVYQSHFELVGDR